MLSVIDTSCNVQLATCPHCLQKVCRLTGEVWTKRRIVFHFIQINKFELRSCRLMSRQCVTLQAIAGQAESAYERTAGNDPPSQVLNNRHDVIMHYVNVITNSGNLKQPGRDTILIDYYYYCYYYDTITAGVILTLIRPRRFAPPQLTLFCFICSFVSCLLCDFTLWRNICALYASVRMQIRFQLSVLH